MWEDSARAAKIPRLLLYVKLPAGRVGIIARSRHRFHERQITLFVLQRKKKKFIDALNDLCEVQLRRVRRRVEACSSAGIRVAVSPRH